MSDERFREFERRWKETGSVEDEAKFLAERVRVGDLTKERLELAAYCGHEAALVAVNGVAPPDDPMRWARGFADKAPHKLRVQAALILARLALYHAPASDTDDAAEAILGAVQEWLRCPCRDHKLAVEGTAQRLPLDLILRGRGSVRSGKAAYIVYLVLEDMTVDREPWPFSARRLDDLADVALSSGVEGEAIKSALREELVPSLLVRE